MQCRWAVVEHRGSIAFWRGPTFGWRSVSCVGKLRCVRASLLSPSVVPLTHCMHRTQERRLEAALKRVKVLEESEAYLRTAYEDALAKIADLETRLSSARVSDDRSVIAATMCYLWV